MSNQIKNAEGLKVFTALVDVIHENRTYLSDIDGKIGDGDHGINMDKGFQIAGGRVEASTSLSDALLILGKTLLLEIGGSMGPLYGQFYKAMAKEIKESEFIGIPEFARMLRAGYTAIQNLGEAKPGDKTLVDTLDPATAAAEKAAAGNVPFPQAAQEILTAAEAGWKSTEDMVAKIGRSSRLGERSRGVLDAGATSCYLMIKAMLTTMQELMK
ncbi:MAG: dihydroxyacetone kinase subunit L [Spirochaetales bacterium]|nr:dihydroxyacetone kinase subunit L [Spirochaetales bacterium]